MIISVIELSSNIKAHGFIWRVFQYLAALRDKNLSNNYCIMGGLKVKLNLVLKFFPQWFWLLVKYVTASYDQGDTENPVGVFYG